MAKIMLVEDDNNLREIYGARLLAEGHDIVAAPDGEEALALAVKEKPDLIISDVMMPRISGFDMLDILRNAPETKETKVIMMTALSQAEDKARADKLGADRYLVKSQVTLEDVANVVREVLEGGNTSEAPPADEPAPAAPAASTPEPASAPTSQPVIQQQPAPQPVVTQTVQQQPAPAPAPAPVPSVAAQPVASVPVPPPAPTSSTNPEPLPNPSPTIPEIKSIPDQPAPAPASPATVEQIANPVVEMPDDSDSTQVQAPPAPTDEPIVAPASAPTSQPVVPTPVAPTPQPVASTPVQPQTAAPAPADLPPVVEPSEPITVIMPTPLDGTREQSSVQQPIQQPVTPPASTDDTSQVIDTQPNVGPSLLETLQAEENENPDFQTPVSTPPAVGPAPTLPLATESESPQPIIANGTTVPPIVTPNHSMVQSPTDTESSAQDNTFSSAVHEGGGMKRVIQPLADSSGPSIDALLAAEEQKAAVENPVANTIIKPLPPTPAPSPVQQQPVAPAPTVQPAPPKNDDVNNIAL